MLIQEVYSKPLRPRIPAFEGVDKHKEAVTPAEAGVPKLLKTLDSRFHGNDGKGVQRSFIDTLLRRNDRGWLRHAAIGEEMRIVLS